MQYIAYVEIRKLLFLTLYKDLMKHSFQNLVTKIQGTPLLVSQFNKEHFLQFVSQFSLSVEFV